MSDPDGRHPWLTSLAAEMRVLRGEEGLPHSSIARTCRPCRRMHDLRRKIIEDHGIDFSRNVYWYEMEKEEDIQRLLRDIAQKGIATL